MPLIDLLNDAGIVTDPAHRNDLLRKYVHVKATDCYEVIVSVAELFSTFGHQQVLVAFETGDGQPLDASEGMARLIVPGDKTGGRFCFQRHHDHRSHGAMKRSWLIYE